MLLNQGLQDNAGRNVAAMSTDQVAKRTLSSPKREGAGLAPSGKKTRISLPSLDDAGNSI
jgi:hypothetical protein